VIDLIGILDPIPPAGTPGFVLPFMANGNVLSTIEGRLPTWTYTCQYIVCYGIVQGMAAVHQQGLSETVPQSDNLCSLAPDQD
jgi:hypothetical protein